MLAVPLPLSFGRKLEDRFFLFCLIILYQSVNDSSVTAAELSQALEKCCLVTYSNPFVGRLYSFELGLYRTSCLNQLPNSVVNVHLEPALELTRGLLGLVC